MGRQKRSVIFVRNRAVPRAQREADVAPSQNGADGQHSVRRTTHAFEAKAKPCGIKSTPLVKLRELELL